VDKYPLVVACRAILESPLQGDGDLSLAVAACRAILESPLQGDEDLSLAVVVIKNFTQKTTPNRS
jgi:hypothetical protein